MIGVYEILVAARGWIRRGWTQMGNARGVDGALLDSHHANAVCWCANGAILRASNSLCGGPYAAGPEPGRLLDQVVGEDYVKWNDHPDRTQAEVLDAFSEAIKLARVHANSSQAGGSE